MEPDGVGVIDDTATPPEVQGPQQGELTLSPDDSVWQMAGSAGPSAAKGGDFTVCSGEGYGSDAAGNLHPAGDVVLRLGGSHGPEALRLRGDGSVSLSEGFKRAIASAVGLTLIDLLGLPEDELPLVRAVLLGDEASRGVLADLLTDKGRCERAERVRNPAQGGEVMADRCPTCGRRFPQVKEVNHCEGCYHPCVADELVAEAHHCERALDFERAYAERAGMNLAELRRRRTVRPCDCGEDCCEGWQSVSHEVAADIDAEGGIDG